MKTFDGLSVSSKFAICGLPIRVDSYKTCSFQCRYCFANGRKVMEFEKNLAVANTDSIERRLNRVLVDGVLNQQNFLDRLLSKRVTWHFGGMSDPFQPCNESLRVTNKIIDIANKHGISMLISTKSDSIHDANVVPTLHAFQLSVSNVHDRKDIEPNVPPIDSRIRLFRELKREGFKVGIRIQPFIPGVSGIDIVKTFEGADHFIIEGLKVIPQDGEQKDFCFNDLGMNPKLFTQMGLLNMLPEYRIELYAPLINYFKDNGISYSVSDNDLRRMGNNRCCCGDTLVRNVPGFDVTALIHDYGHWTLETILDKVKDYGDCIARDLFTSNRTNGCKTVREFYLKRFGRGNNPMSPKYQYVPEQNLF